MLHSPYPRVLRVPCRYGLARLGALLPLLALWLLLTGFTAPGASPTAGGADRVTETELDALQRAYPPTLSARAAAVVDLGTGRTLYSLGGDRRLPIASTTKMMTALLVSELADPEEVATVYARDLVGGSTAGLRAGERFTVEELLYAALLPSGNDAAMTLADHVGRERLGGVGDEGVRRFVRAMNARAELWGLDDTRFRNPMGYDAPGHYSSALDLAQLGRRVLRDPLISGVVATTKRRVAGYVGGRAERQPVYHPVETTNELLGSYRGATGVKTGTTRGAGEALVASAERGETGLVAVVLGSSDRFGDVRALLDWGFSQHRWLPLSARAFGAAPGAGADGATVHAAAARWNTDLLLLTPGRQPRYWAATEPLDVAPLPEAAP
jgi:D-alanyl-D-alanine carboxypeptidase (penicillin-binding protein 5/6)